MIFKDFQYFSNTLNTIMSVRQLFLWADEVGTALLGTVSSLGNVGHVVLIIDAHNDDDN